MNQKGFVTEIGWTLFLLIVVTFIIFIGILVTAFLHYRGAFTGTEPYSAEFVVIDNKPYLLASTLTHLLAGDRQFIEHAMEIVAAGDIAKANSEEIGIYLKEIFRQYKDNKFMSVSIKTIKDDKEEELFYADNIPKKCGNDLSGFCVDKKRRVSTDVAIPRLSDVGCSDGRVNIDQSKYTQDENKCTNKDELCCVEGNLANDFWPEGTITCGKKGDEDGKIDRDDPGVCDFTISGCTEGRVEIDDVNNECSFPFPSEKTGVCCVPLKADILVESGIASTAEIPLVYKDRKGVVEVTVR